MGNASWRLVGWDQALRSPTMPLKVLGGTAQSLVPPYSGTLLINSASSFESNAFTDPSSIANCVGRRFGPPKPCGWPFEPKRGSRALNGSPHARKWDETSPTRIVFDAPAGKLSRVFA